MNFSQHFQDSFGNLPPVVRGLCQGMDEQEMALERVRVSLGFGEDWSPAYDRRQRSGTTASIKWADKAAGMNGTGDMRGLIEEMCRWMDTMVEKRAEIEAHLVDLEDRAKEAQLGRIADPNFEYRAGVIDTTPPAACPKCGKTGRGLAMHIKSCGKAA